MMKATLFALFVGLLMVGCGEGLLLDKLHLNGKHTEYYDDGQKKEEGNYKDSEKQGLWTTWYENGQKEEEANWKDDELDGLLTYWHENGKKEGEINFKDGEEDGLETWWYSTGQKEAECTYREGKLMSAEVWKPNGEKCPVTNIDEDGNGVWLEYKEDGTESYRYTFKDGEPVED